MAAGNHHEACAALWPSGQFINLTLQEIRCACVDKFPDSITRRGLMDDFEAVLGRLTQSRIEGEVWLDGSFVTSKVNPRDIDFILRCPSTLRPRIAPRRSAFASS